MATRFVAEGRMDVSTRSDSSSLATRRFFASPSITTDHVHDMSFPFAAAWMIL
jgi:hypothetical protein